MLQIVALTIITEPSVRLHPAMRRLLRLRRYATSKSDSLRGAIQVTTPKERHENEARTRSTPDVRAAQYQRDREMKPADDATARILRQQEARRAQWQASPIYEGQSLGVTNSFMDAAFQKMEREGGFKNLKGSGEPLPHRDHTHLGGEDANQKGRKFLS